MFTFAVSLIEHALMLLDRGIVRFTTDIVPAHDRGTGPGIAGSVIELLKNASVIEPIGIRSQGIWYAERVKSERPESKARYLNVLKLTSRHLAEMFLERNGRHYVGQPSRVAPTQPNLV